MTFTENAAIELAKSAIPWDMKIHMRTNYSESNTWEDVPHVQGSISVKRRRNKATVLDFRPINKDFAYSARFSKYNRVQYFADLRVIGTLGDETQIIFDGRLERIRPKDFDMKSGGRDWRCLIEECQCDIDFAPDEIEAVAYGTYRRIYPLTQYPGLFAFAVDGSGTDPAFDEGTQSVRRPWAPSNLRVYYLDDGEYIEVSPSHWNVDFFIGSLQILEETTGREYYVSNVRCHLESSATGATCCDWAEVVKMAVKHPKASLGMGLTDDDIDMPATGIDMAGACRFQGRVDDLLDWIQKNVQRNLEYSYDSATQKHKFRVVTQQEDASADYTLGRAQSVAQSRDIRDLASAYVTTGIRPQPANALTTAVSITPLLTSGIQWLVWNGEDDSNSDFNTAITRIYDGDDLTGLGVTKLPAASNAERYDTWYELFEIELDERAPIDQVIAVMPPSWHWAANSRATLDAAWLWPRIQLLGRPTTSDPWLPVSPALDKMAYRPGTVVDVGSDEITRPDVKFIKVVAAPYKHGNNNYKNPSCGLMELVIIQHLRYREEATIYHSEHTVTAVDQGNKTFTIAGDFVADLPNGETIEVLGSPGSANDGLYTIVSRSLSGSDTVLTVAEAIPSATAGGAISPVALYSTHTPQRPRYWRRACPGLATLLGADPDTRQGMRHRSVERDLGDEHIPEIARDIAIKYLASLTALYDSVTYVAVCDPRVNAADTVIVNDEFNGDVGGMLVDGVDITETTATIYGTNYRAATAGVN